VADNFERVSWSDARAESSQTTARRENRTARTAAPIDRDFVNFYDLDDGSLWLSRGAVDQAPPLTATQFDVLSTLLGLVPADLDVVTHGEFGGSPALGSHGLHDDLVA
jgi:hypothetical protein